MFNIAEKLCLWKKETWNYWYCDIDIDTENIDISQVRAMWRRKLPFDGSLQGKPQLSSPSMLPQHYGHFKMETYILPLPVL